MAGVRELAEVVVEEEGAAVEEVERAWEHVVTVVVRVGKAMTAVVGT